MGGKCQSQAILACQVQFGSKISRNWLAIEFFLGCQQRPGCCGDVDALRFFALYFESGVGTTKLYPFCSQNRGGCFQIKSLRDTAGNFIEIFYF